MSDTSKLRSIAVATESTFGTAETTDWGSGATRIPAEKIELTLEQTSLPVDARTDTFGLHQAPVLGGKGGKLSLEVPLVGATTNAGGLVTPATWLDKLLTAACMQKAAGTGTTVSSGSSSTVFDVASASGITAGSVVGVQISGTIHWRCVKTKSSNTLTVTPALPSTPSNSDVVYASASYILTSDPSSLTILCAYDSVEYVLTGCVSKPPVVEAKANERAMLKFEFMVDSWSAQSVTGAPTSATLPTVTPLKGLGASFHLGTSATAVAAESVSVDPGVSLEALPAIGGTNGRSAWKASDARPRGKAGVYYASQHLTDHAAGTALPFVCKLGGAAQATVVFGGEAFVHDKPAGPADRKGALGQEVEGVFAVPSSATNPIVLAVA